MPTLAKPLTKRAIDTTPADAARDLFLWDGGDGAVKGFGLRIRASGRKTFVFQYDASGGRTRRVTLGDYGALTVEQARDAARTCAADAAAAKRDPAHLDPAAKVRKAKRTAEAERRAPTVAALAALYLEDRRRKGKRALTLDQFQGLFARHVAPALGDRKVADVGRRDIERLVASLEKTPGTANRVLTMLAAMFGFAEREELRAAHTNPTLGVERYPAPRRARSLTEVEHAALGATLARAEREGLPVRVARRKWQERARAAARAAAGVRERPARQEPWDPRTVALIRFLALSGWRESEARRLRWGELDLGRAVAVLLDTKTGRSTRPLGQDAVATLKALPRELGNAHVFPGKAPRRPRKPSQGTATELGKPRGNARRAWSVVRDAAGLDGTAEGMRPVRIHDLRHSFTTVARGLGYGDHVIAALIGHTIRGGMTSRYGDVPDALVRQAADAVASAIAKMLEMAPAEGQGGASVPRRA